MSANGDVAVRLGRWVVTAVGALGYAFLLAPLLVILVASFAGGQTHYVVFPPTSFSIEWYFRLPADYFRPALISVGVALASGLVSTVLGVFAAFGLVRGRLPGRNLLRAYFNVPLQIPFVVTGIVFLQFYYILYALTGARLLGTVWGLLGVHVFITLPYMVGTVAAVLERFDPLLEEAALTLGATRWSTLRRVTLPLVKPGVVAGALYAFVVSFGDVPASMFVVSTATTTLPVQLFYAMEFDYTPALLALCSLVVAVSMAAIFAVQWVLGFDFVQRGRAGG
jgi:putative spermidine/putrescine transport system permease protein